MQKIRETKGDFLPADPSRGMSRVNGLCLSIYLVLFGNIVE